MPTKIEFPDIDDIELLNTIVSERENGANKIFFQTYKSTWIQRYAEYISNLGNPESINNSTLQTDKSKFINLYLSKPHSIETCIIDPLKDIYPEYSILTKNLVPACDACQKADAKGSKECNDDGERLFLHPYYDNIDGLEILKLEIVPPYDRGTNYILTVSDDIINQPLKSLCERHIETLLINDRFRIFFSAEFIRLKMLVLEMIYENGIDREDIINFLKMFHSKEKKVSINYWHTIFYKAVIEDENLIEYLKSLENE